VRWRGAAHAEPREQLPDAEGFAYVVVGPASSAPVLFWPRADSTMIGTPVHSPRRITSSLSMSQAQIE
jgi:hypothetical protein